MVYNRIKPNNYKDAYYNLSYTCGVGSLMFLGISYLSRKSLDATQLETSVRTLENIIDYSNSLVYGFIFAGFAFGIFGSLEEYFDKKDKKDENK